MVFDEYEENKGRRRYSQVNNFVILSSGLSSILDLINVTNTSQKSLFNDQEWMQLVNFDTSKIQAHEVKPFTCC
jgi:hypothetical protein